MKFFENKSLHVGHVACGGTHTVFVTRPIAERPAALSVLRSVQRMFDHRAVVIQQQSTNNMVVENNTLLMSGAAGGAGSGSGSETGQDSPQPHQPSIPLNDGILDSDDDVDMDSS